VVKRLAPPIPARVPDRGSGRPSPAQADACASSAYCTTWWTTPPILARRRRGANTGKLGGWRVAVAVSDHGIGMSSEQQQMLFEPFGRLDKRRAAPGLGWGWWSARGCEAHGGDVCVESAPGRARPLPSGCRCKTTRQRCIYSDRLPLYFLKVLLGFLSY